MNINSFIFYPLLIGLLIFTIAFFKWPKYAIAALIIAKPIIDLTWDYFILLDINFLKLYAGLFVILGVIYIIIKRVPILTSHGSLLSFHCPRLSSPGPSLSFPGLTRESSNCHPEPQDCHSELGSESLRGSIVSGAVSESTQNSPFHRFSVSPFHFLTILWLIFLVLNIVSIFIISDAHLLLGKINYFLRILTGFVALIMFAHLFDYKKDKKFVLSIFIIAGIFPILLWLIPVIMGNPIISNDELRRIMGPYLNFWNFNFYATQTLICCLAYLSFSQLRNFSSSQPHLLSSSQLLKFIASKLRLLPSSRHCEERSDEAISTSSGVEPLGSSKSTIPETPKHPYSVLRCHSLACCSPELYVEGIGESSTSFTLSAGISHLPIFLSSFFS